MEKRNNINGLGNPHYNRSLAGLTKKLWIKGEPVGKINRIIEKRLTKKVEKSIINFDNRANLRRTVVVYK